MLQAFILYPQSEIFQSYGLCFPGVHDNHEAMDARG